MTLSISQSLSASYTATMAVEPTKASLLDDYFLSYPIDAKEIMSFFVELKSAQAILEHAFIGPEKEKVSIVFDGTIKNRALLNFNTNTIALNCSLLGLSEKCSTKGKVAGICATIFEFCNYKRKDKFKDLEKRAKEYSEDRFVEEWERLEHESTLEANAFIIKLNLEGHLPKDAPLTVVSKDFQDHYLVQQLSGHSQDIALKHQSLVQGPASYKGTWKIPVKEDEKRYLRAYLTFKALAEISEAHLKEKALASMHQLVQICKTSKQDLHIRLARHFQKLASS